MDDKYVASATAYAKAVAAGEVLACKWVRAACQRQLDDLARSESDPDWPWRFDAEAAWRPCDFIEMLPHIKGKWARERRRITLEPWQMFILTTVFGWVHRETGLRRFTEAYIEVARKNAKSTLTAGLCLFMLMADGEAGAEVYTAATTRDQARIVFDDAKAMAQREPEMREALGVDVLQHALVVPDSSSKLVPLAAEGSTLDGLNVHFACVDELHAHKTRAVYDVLDTARGAREQPLLWNITTAGSDRSGICYERRTHITKVLDRVIDDDRQFGLIYTLDEGDDWQDERVWPKANPNYGVSVFPEVLRTACRKAQAMPSAQANFLTKHLNVWVNADAAWMDMAAWQRCGDPTLTVERVKHLRAVAGLDLASKVDIAAAPLLLHDADADHYYLITRGRFWLPERAIELSTNSQYAGWVQSGWLIATDGEVTDYDAIEDQLRVDAAQLENLAEIAFDPWQATQLSSHMLDEGLPMIEVRQTVANLSEPMKQLQAIVLQRKLTHDASPAMDWMISNVVCHYDAKDNIYPRKERPENKIDGPVAAITGLARLIAAKPSADIGEFLSSPLVA
jgi:phage terminase large subunit-like protein